MYRNKITALCYALTAMLVVVLSGVGPSGTAHAGLAPTANCGRWSIVPSPSPSQAISQLNGVAAISSTDVWAVGDWYNLTSAELTLVEHWDGTRWSVVPSPSPGGTRFGSGSVLRAVTAISTSNVWAVGSYTPAPYAPFVTLVEHWDGARWSVVPSPTPSSPPPANGQLSGVTALSPTDVWAVGSYNDNAIGFLQTLIEHWNGTKWSIVPSPNAGGQDDELNGVAAASAGDVWAVGYFTSPTQGYGFLRTLAERWNGTGWSVVPSPNRSPNRNVFDAVAVATPGSVWAVGYAGIEQPPARHRSAVAVTGSVQAAGSAGRTNYSLTEEWDGTRWSIVPSPNVGTDPKFDGVVAVSPGDVWAVGHSYRPRTQVRETLTTHWDGVRWSVVPSPNVGTNENFLDGVVHVAGTNELWAVGYYDNGPSPFPTLIEHYC